VAGCEDCQTSYVSECLAHHLQPVSDKVILSRAWASLPLVLQIFRLSETADAQNAGQMILCYLACSRSLYTHIHILHILCSSVVECRSLTKELSLACVISVISLLLTCSYV